MTQTSLGYTGTLVLETKTRRAVARNHGTLHLFRLLSTLLCKEPYSVDSLPTYFMLYKGTVSEIISAPDTAVNISKQLLRGYVDIVSQASSVDSVFESTFTSTIDSSMLVSKLSEGERANLTLGLISGDKRSILAAVEFDSATYGIVSDGGQTFVKWIMSISNSDDIVASAIGSILEG